MAEHFGNGRATESRALNRTFSFASIVRDHGAVSVRLCGGVFSMLGGGSAGIISFPTRDVARSASSRQGSMPSRRWVCVVADAIGDRFEDLLDSLQAGPAYQYSNAPPWKAADFKMF